MEATNLQLVTFVDGSPLTVEHQTQLAKLHQMVVQTMKTGVLVTQHPETHNLHKGAHALKERPEIQQLVDGRCLRRYLVAQKFDVMKAYDALLGTLYWRTHEMIHALANPTFDDCLQTRYMEWFGRDRQGRPLLWIKSNNANLDIKRDRRMQFAILAMEKGLSLMTKPCGGHDGLEQWIMIIDETDKEFKHMDNKFLSRLSPILSSHYVERLCHCYLINPGILTQAVLTAVKLFMDDRTKNKIHMVYGTPDEKLKGVMPVPKLIASLGEENVPVQYGGTMKPRSFEEYYTFFKSLPYGAVQS